MTWVTFFNSKPFKYGACGGTVGLLASASCSLALAFYLSHLCNKDIKEARDDIGTTINIPSLKLSVYIPELGKTITRTYKNIEIEIPQNYLHMLAKENQKLPEQSFNICLIIGMCLSAFIALNLVCTSFNMGLYLEQIEKNVERDYSLMGTDESSYTCSSARSCV